MRMAIFRLLLLQLVFISPYALATGTEDPRIATLIAQAAEKDLARHPYWMRLVHYKPTVLGAGAVVSEIVSPDFFLAERGRRDPESELAATLRAFFRPAATDGSEHPQCRFIARYRWLRGMLDWREIPLPSVPCERFEAWSRHGRFSSLSLVFATGYFSNPASYNGHLLLKFNTDDSPDTSGLLDESLNFGAIVPDDENALIYVTKGMFGGYQSAFSNTRFYRQNHDYGESELRDMWEYELSLSKDEVDRIAAHGWELLHVRFTYYFAKENCAYQMAQLLGLAIAEPLLNEDLPWAMPSAVFDRLVRIERNGRPLVRGLRLIPSRLSRFHAGYDVLGDGERDLVRDWALGRADLSGPQYKALPEARKIALIQPMLDYAEFRMARDNEDGIGPAWRQKLLLERVQLPTGNGQTPVTGIEPPHTGPLPVMVRAGVTRNTLLGNGVTVRMRPTYFDALSLDTGRIPHATLTMLDLDVTAFNDKFRLSRLDLIHIEHLDIAHTPLPADGGWAWRVRAGFASHDLSCHPCVLPRLEGGLGKAMRLAAGVSGYGMVDLLLQESYRDAGAVAGSARAGLLLDIEDGWKSNLEWERRSYLDGTRDGEWIPKWENRFGSRRDRDVRLAYRRHVASEWQAAISFYW